MSVTQKPGKPLNCEPVGDQTDRFFPATKRNGSAGQSKVQDGNIGLTPRMVSNRACYFPSSREERSAYLYRRKA